MPVSSPRSHHGRPSVSGNRRRVQAPGACGAHGDGETASGETPRSWRTWRTRRSRLEVRKCWNLSQNRLKRITRQASWTKPQEILGMVLPADEDSALPLNPSEEALNEPAAHIAG